jgi:hypothetical protein
VRLVRHVENVELASRDAASESVYSSNSTTMDSSASALEPLFAFLSYALIQAELAFFKIPGSHVIARYVKSSHQNDPGRTVLEVLLALFAIRTLLQSRTRADNGEKHFIKFSEKARLSPFFYGDAQHSV